MAEPDDDTPAASRSRSRSRRALERTAAQTAKAVTSRMASLRLAIAVALVTVTSLILAACGHERSEPPPVYVAVARGDTSELTSLLEDGADPDDMMGYEAAGRPLWLAVEDGDVQTARLLVDHGADIDFVERSNINWTYLHSAARWADVEMVEFLIDAGADPCERVLDDAPLRTADPELPDARGMTPLDVAKSIQNDRAIPVLLEASKSC